MKKIIFKGAGSAVPTPFDENGVNIKEFKRFLKFQIENEIDALIVCGTTGESSTMTREEKIQVIKCALEVSNGRVPVIAGTGSNNTNEAIKSLYQLCGGTPKKTPKVQLNGFYNNQYKDLLELIKE